MSHFLDVMSVLTYSQDDVLGAYLFDIFSQGGKSITREQVSLLVTALGDEG
jgi:hypothetical protein